MFAVRVDPRPSSSRHLSSSSSSRSSVFPSSALARPSRLARRSRLLASSRPEPAKPSNRPPRERSPSPRARASFPRVSVASIAREFSLDPLARASPSPRRRVAASRLARPRALAKSVRPSSSSRRARRVARVALARRASRARILFAPFTRRVGAATSRSTAVARDVTTRDGVADAGCRASVHRLFPKTLLTTCPYTVGRSVVPRTGRRRRLDRWDW